MPDNAPVDVIAQLSDEFAVNGVAKPGDTAQTMTDFFHPSVTQDLQFWGAHLLLLSAGGNDLLGEGKLATFLRDATGPCRNTSSPSSSVSSRACSAGSNGWSGRRGKPSPT